MGSSGGKVVQAEEVVTPAVGRDIARDTESAQANQQTACSRMRGIRGTYSRFANQGGANLATKLG